MSKPIETIAYELCDPFPASQISWRVGSTNKKAMEKKNGTGAKATKGQALCYIDARDVMNRLDKVVGFDNWQDSYRETDTGRTICTLSIRINGEWVSKSDGAANPKNEGAKGSISDSFKRAAVKWGIFRYGYAIDCPWVELDDREGLKYAPSVPHWAVPGGLQKAPELRYAETEEREYETDPEEPPKPKAPDGLAVAVKWGAENIEHMIKCGLTKQWNEALDSSKMGTLNELRGKVSQYKKDNGL